MLKIHRPTTPGPGADKPDCGTPGTTRLKTRSIPHVATARLHRRLAILHDMLHTADGLHAHDAPRRGLIDNGVKVVGIRHELAARGHVLDTGCNFCDGRTP